jgi:hypothetical protein
MSKTLQEKPRSKREANRHFDQSMHDALDIILKYGHKHPDHPVHMNTFNVLCIGAHWIEKQKGAAR